ncbi:MAG TPA: isocitrate lyase/phosphoenolpyruvate mutase family protein [Thermoanaerobaculia bacterium]|jgi:2-methylisocitrate lyase-like PEP mutase family enzyme|nr:isocitrate lyase/phosphoenolpyruvate mutase family protein [Thermoanaerobaculia bacterium]
MPSQSEKAETFTRLHVPGSPVVLFNVWDPGSARVVAQSGAQALATGSWSVAAAFGFGDGEEMPFDLALENLRRIVAAVDLPVTLDFEGGYGITPEAVGKTFAQALDAGAIGCNFEDRVVDAEDRLYSIEDQSARIAALREAAKSAGVPAYINARTDLFLNADPAQHDDALVEQALERAAAYAQAGASGFFVPGLVDEALLKRVCEGTPLPINVMYFPGVPPALRLAELGVARISHGPGPYRLAMKALEEAARTAFTPIVG